MKRHCRSLLLYIWSNPLTFIRTNFLSFERKTNLFCSVSLNIIDGGLLAALVSAANSKALFSGTLIHCHTVKLGFSSHIFYQNNLIKLYLSCGQFESGVKVFGHMPERNLISWTLVVSSAVQCEEPEFGVIVFQDMRRVGLMPNEFALGSVLKGCVSIGNIAFAFCSHCLALKIGIDSNQFVGSSILHMYAKFGHIEEAQKVFRNISCSDVGSWNAMIGGYAENGYGFEALSILYSMLVEGLVLDSVTFINALKGCLVLGCLQVAKEIHDYGLKIFRNIPEKDVVSWNTLISSFCMIQDSVEIPNFLKGLLASHANFNCITFALLFKYCGMVDDLYLGLQIYSLALQLGISIEASVVSSSIYMFSTCGRIMMARLVFDIASLANTVVWNEMISGYHFNCFFKEALIMFKEFSSLGFEKNDSTYSVVLDVCSCSGDQNTCTQIHCAAIKIGLINNKYVLSSLIRCYARCGLLDDYFKFFNENKFMDLEVWGIMFSELMHCGRSNQIMGLLSCLLKAGLKPDEFILACIFNASAAESAYCCTTSSHALVVKLGFAVHVFVASSLINAYAKCGDVECARMVFRQSASSDDVVLFNTIIMGYAHHGLLNEALQIFNDVNSAKLKPTQATFVSIMSACNHFGLVDLGRVIFNSMKFQFNVQPSRDVYGCLVDMLGRHGFLEEARKIIEELPFPAWPAVWRSFLSACGIHQRLELAKWAACNLLRLTPKNDAAYILLSRVYSGCGNWENAAKMSMGMVKYGVRKRTGRSWIET